MRNAPPNPDRERLLDELGLQCALSAIETLLDTDSKKADRTGAQEVTKRAPGALGPSERPPCKG